MSATESLLRLVGSVSILLWGLYMVRTGITRAFGGELQQIIGRAVSNRFSAFISGIFVTLIVQSSTATALIISSFASRGVIGLTAALAVMLGADVGTTIVAQILSFDLSLLPYILAVTGLVLHGKNRSSKMRQVGRSVFGLGLMLLALSLIVATSEPLRDSGMLAELFGSLRDEPLIAILLAALLTWVAHSSLAIVLLVMSFALGGIISIELAFMLVLGANLGGALPPIMATLNEGDLARRVTFGNAGFKLIGVILVLPFVGVIQPYLQVLGDDPARLVVNFHTAFNIGIAIVFLPVVHIAGRIWERLIKSSNGHQDDELPRFLDENAVNTPVLGLACATREVTHMAEIVDQMLRGVTECLESDDYSRVEELIELDDQVDNLYDEIKGYVTRISRQEVDQPEGDRIVEILMFTTNLEHMADIAENLLGALEKRSKMEVGFSKEGLADLLTLNKRLTTNLTLAINVFMSGDVAIARQLIKDKSRVNKMQNEFVYAHMERLKEGRMDSLGTSSLHMDILRDQRRIHSHITAVAYPVLEQAGGLRKSRLKKSS
ncbi:MAG: Na/Pi cotransporter family protein [Rhodobacteraceae bacterium]|nr:Na/Pi cotransporter family protein [Paracoccaceae bacterium]